MCSRHQITHIFKSSKRLFCRRSVSKGKNVLFIDRIWSELYKPCLPSDKFSFMSFTAATNCCSWPPHNNCSRLKTTAAASRQLQPSHNNCSRLKTTAAVSQQLQPPQDNCSRLKTTAAASRPQQLQQPLHPPAALPLSLWEIVCVQVFVRVFVLVCACMYVCVCVCMCLYVFMMCNFV